MTDRKKLQRTIILCFIFLSLSIANFSRLSGTENIRAIQYVSLLAIGMLFGVMLVTIIMFFKSKKE